MFDYLSAPLGVGRHRIRLPRYLYVQNGLRENLLKHQTYYRKNLTTVDNRNLLVRLIHSSPLPFLTSDRHFLDAAKDLMYEVASSLDLTTNVSRGEVHYPGPFYGLGVSEAILVHDEHFDTYVEWQTLKPIRIHRHPVTGLHLQPLDGESRGASGWASISINYPMLMWMYRQWRLSDESFIEDYQLSIAHFVAMVLLPSAMGDHIDNVIFNRLYNDLFKLRDLDAENKSSFYLIDYEEKLDESLEDYLSQIGRKTLSIEELLSSIPMVVSDTLYDITRSPDIIQNNQTIWWLWASFIPVNKVWVAYDYLSDNKRNRSESKDLLRSIKRTQRSRWLPKDLEEEVSKELKDLEDWLTA